MDRETDERREAAEQTAILGLQVQGEITSPTIQWLLSCAEDEQDKALSRIAGLNPYTADGRAQIMECKSHVRACNLVKEWIATAIEAGKNATKALAAEDGVELREE